MNSASTQKWPVVTPPGRTSSRAGPPSAWPPACAQRGTLWSRANTSIRWRRGPSLSEHVSVCFLSTGDPWLGRGWHRCPAAFSSPTCSSHDSLRGAGCSMPDAGIECGERGADVPCMCAELCVCSGSAAPSPRGGDQGPRGQAELVSRACANCQLGLLHPGDSLLLRQQLGFGMRSIFLMTRLGRSLRALGRQRQAGRRSRPSIPRAAPAGRCATSSKFPSPSVNPWVWARGGL